MRELLQRLDTWRLRTYARYLRWQIAHTRALIARERELM